MAVASGAPALKCEREWARYLLRRHRRGQTTLGRDCAKMVLETVVPGRGYSCEVTGATEQRDTPMHEGLDRLFASRRDGPCQASGTGVGKEPR